MKTIFALRNKSNVTSKYSVYVEYCYKTKVKRFATGIKVLESDFNTEKGLIKKNGSTQPELDNNHIHSVKSKIDNLIKEFFVKHSRYPTLEEITELKEETIKPVYEKKLIDFLNEYVQQKKEECKPNTFKAFAQLKVNLSEYLKLNKLNISFEEINYNFLEEYTKFLIKKKYLNTTISKRLIVFRQFMGESLARGFHSNTKYLTFRFKANHSDNEPVTLSKKELDSLKALDLSNNKKLERVRNLFLLQSYLGVRFSDLMNIRDYHIQNDYIVIATQKTSKIVKIPLFPVAKEVLEKYDYQIKPISNVKYNKYLKEVCQLVPELSEIIVQVEFNGVKRIEIIEPKYKFIGSHTARRNFITIMLELGVNPQQVMLWSGHSDTRMLQKYVNKKQGQEKEINLVMEKLNTQI